MGTMRDAFGNAGYTAARAPQARTNNGYNQQPRNNSGYNQQQRQAVPRVRINLESFDVVAEAEKAVSALDKKPNGDIKLTTSQIRKFLTAVSYVHNKAELFFMQNKTAKELSDDLAADVKFLKVDLLYLAGKDDSRQVKKFVDISKLPEIIDEIKNDRSKFNKLCKYVEALVAYRKFLGGKDK